ncbi:MAG: CBS domain-containing protein [Minwuia sp.]|nr:CBS domain-containing protein [Minwuia sp.]
MSDTLTHVVRQFIVEHPSAAARALADWEPQRIGATMGRLDRDTARKLLDHLDPLRAVPVLLGMPDEIRANLIRGMAPSDIARLLRQANDADAAALLESLPKTLRARVALVMSQPKSSVGALMATDVARARGAETVETVTARVRRARPVGWAPIYLVDSANRPTGALSPLDLMRATPDSLIADLPVADVAAIPAAAAVHMAAEDDDWLEHEIRPAVDRRGRLVGCIGYGDLRRALMASESASTVQRGDRSALDTMVLLETGLTGTMTALLAGRSPADGREERA